jgi:phage terminase Nu1 subunit (DNA packaging protein)
MPKKRTSSKSSKHSAAAKPRIRLVGIAAIAERLRLTPRRIQQLAGEGLPRVTRGKYDVDAVLDWYVAKLERQLARQTDEDGDIALREKEEMRMLSAKADLQELDLASRRRELVSIADVEKTMTDLVITTKARILTVPARVAPEILGEQSRVMVQAKIEKALKESLSHLSEESNANHTSVFKRDTSTRTQ